MNLLLAGKNFLSTHALRILYFAQIYSNLTYGISMWGSQLTNENIKKLQKIQNKCMYIVGRGLGPLDELYAANKILTVNRLIKLELCKLWHKKQLGLLPCKLSATMSCDQWEQPLDKSHRYPTRQKELANRPRPNHHEYHDSFLVRGNRIYSHLNQELISCNTLHKFTKQLKEKLIARA